jgi:hypothetical protein
VGASPLGLSALSPRGQTGSVVVAGQLDVEAAAPARSSHWGPWRVGDRIEVIDEDGTARHFSVAASATYRKDELPLDVLFSGQGPRS